MSGVEPPASSAERSPGVQTPRGGNAKPGLWVSTTYFAEGYPYSIVNNLAEVMFKEMGASLQVIGLTSLLHLPWNLKFLWAPLVDQIETKRRWLVWVEVALTIGLVALSLSASGSHLLVAAAALFVALAVLAATHDIAIDGYYLEALDTAGQSRFVGFRAMAYKAASLLVRGPIVMLIGWVGWRLGLAAAAAVMAALTIVHWRVLPGIETRKRPWLAFVRSAIRPRVLTVGAALAAAIILARRFGHCPSWLSSLRQALPSMPWLAELSAGSWIAIGLLAVLALGLAVRKPLARRMALRESAYAAAFVDFMARPMVGRVLAFVVLFRAGESFLQKMKWPFLRDVLHLSLDQYGFANGTLGVVASFLGTFAGGWLISHQGLRRWIWPFALMQNVLHLLYMGLAIAGARMAVGLLPIGLVIMLENFGEGLGTAVFMVYLMRSCDPSHKASHMAILTALMSVSFTVAGVASGFLAKAMGFAWFFGFTFLAALPGMVLIAFLPNIDGPSQRAQGSPSS